MWSELPGWFRLLFVLFLFGVAALILFFVSVRLGFVAFGVALIALIFVNRTDSEKKGYRF